MAPCVTKARDREGGTVRRLIRARVGVGLGVLAVALAGGTYALAAGNGFVGPHGNINACVPRKGGEVTVWKPGHHCSRGGVSLAFARTGQRGPSGPRGATGATGASNPSAVTVDNETVTKIFFKVPTQASPTNTTLFSGDGLTLIGQCDNAGNPTVQATGPATDDAEITWTDTTTVTGGGQVTTLGTTMTQLALGPASTAFSYASSAGQVVTGQIGDTKTPGFGESLNGCAFFGTVTSG